MVSKKESDALSNPLDDSDEEKERAEQLERIGRMLNEYARNSMVKFESHA